MPLAKSLSFHSAHSGDGPRSDRATGSETGTEPVEAGAERDSPDPQDPGGEAGNGGSVRGAGIVSRKIRSPQG